jgi:D-glycero-D-manno-heptose 1,7-bisphosphate phosphatase
MHVALTVRPSAAVLLDRDGVINRERRDYVRRWEEFDFLPGALKALQHLAELGVPVVVLTNQSVIGRGLVPASIVEQIHGRMLEGVRAQGGRIDAVLVCPHQPTAGCGCRKPMPGLFHMAARRLGVTLRESFYVGDSLSDFQVACEVGCRPILVRTGLQGAKLPALLPREPTLLVDDLAAAVRLISLELREAPQSAPIWREAPGLI